MADILLGNVKGPQGNTGATGSQGPQGDAATITVGTVSTTAYGNTAQVTNSGTEQDAILDFVIPQGKPGEQTTRMGALTLDTITAQSADFPIPVVGETGSTVFGKIIKFFNSTVSALNSKLNIFDVVNNLTSTSTTQPLSAAQGKELNDALSTTNTNLSNITTKRRVFSFNKTLAGNAYASATVTASELGLEANEYIKICSVHHPWAGSASAFVAGIQMGYRVGDGNQSVIIDLYNSASASKTFVVQTECLTAHVL